MRLSGRFVIQVPFPGFSSHWQLSGSHLRWRSVNCIPRLRYPETARQASRQYINQGRLDVDLLPLPNVVHTLRLARSQLVGLNPVPQL